MAIALTLGDGTTIINLTAGAYKLAEAQMQWPPPPLKELWTPSPVGSSRLVRHKHDLSIGIIPLYLEGSTIDALNQARSDIDAMLERGRQWAALEGRSRVRVTLTMDGAVYPMEKTVLSGTLEPPPDFHSVRVGATAALKYAGHFANPWILKLICEPYWRGAAETLENRLRTASFERDINSDGLADYWTKETDRSSFTITPTIDSTAANIKYGQKSQKLVMSRGASSGEPTIVGGRIRQAMASADWAVGNALSAKVSALVTALTAARVNANLAFRIAPTIATGALRHLASTKFSGHKAIELAEATTNLLANPSVETNTTSFVATSGTEVLTKTADAASPIGDYKLVVSNLANAGDGTYQEAVSFVAGATYTFSCWVKGTLGELFRLVIQDGVTTQQTANQTFTGAWERKSFTVTIGGGATLLRCRISRITTGAGSFDTDGWLMEQKAYATPYWDGDQLSIDEYPIVNQDSSEVMNDQVTTDKNQLAVSFTTGDIATEIRHAWLYLKKGGGPTANLTLEIQTDNNGVPSGTLLGGASAAVDPGVSITATYLKIYFRWTAGYPTPAARTRYWVVLKYASTFAVAASIDWGTDISSPVIPTGEALATKASGSWATVANEWPCFGVFHYVSGWAGVPHASSSARLASRLAFSTANTVNQATGSIIVIFRIVDALITGSNSWFWSMKGAGDNRLRIGKDLNHKLIGSFGDSASAIVSVTTLAVGIDYIAILTYTNASQKLYLGGVQEGSTATKLALTALGTTFDIGALEDGTQNGNVQVHAVMVFDSILSAGDISSITAEANKRDLRFYSSNLIFAYWVERLILENKTTHMRNGATTGEAGRRMGRITSINAAYATQSVANVTIPGGTDEIVMELEAEALSIAGAPTATVYFDGGYVGVQTTMPVAWSDYYRVLNHIDDVLGDLNYIDAADIPGEVEAIADCVMTVQSATSLREFRVGRIAAPTPWSHDFWEELETYTLLSETVAISNATGGGTASGGDHTGNTRARITETTSTTDKLRAQKENYTPYLWNANPKVRAWLRIKDDMAGGLNIFKWHLNVLLGLSATVVVGPTRSAPIQADFALIDMGEFALPIYAVDPAQTLLDNITFRLYGQESIADANTVQVDSLLLMPADQLLIVAFPNYTVGEGIAQNAKVKIAGREYPAGVYQVNSSDQVAGAMVTFWDSLTGEPFIIAPNQQQRFIFSFDRGSSVNRIEDELAIKMVYEPRFVLPRGS